MEPPDPDGTKNDGGRAGGTTSPVSCQERGDPAKKERLEATATGLAVGEAHDRKTVAVDRSREMRSTDGEALKEVEAMMTYRYCTTWEGMRLDFPGWMTNPKRDNSEDSQKILEERLLRGILDQPCVEVSDAYGYPENGI